MAAGEELDRIGRQVEQLFIIPIMADVAMECGNRDISCLKSTPASTGN
jgi:hypothetical protein